MQNNPSQKTKAHNTWVVVESEKSVECDENFKIAELIKRPSIFKKPTDTSDKCNVYTLGKYLSKYEFGSGGSGSDSRKQSKTRKTSATRRRNSKTKLDLDAIQKQTTESLRTASHNIPSP